MISKIGAKCFESEEKGTQELGYRRFWVVPWLVWLWECLYLDAGLLGESRWELGLRFMITGIDQDCLGVALLQSAEMLYGFCKDWKMTEIISLTEGMMGLLMKIEGKRRRRFVREHICYRGPGVEGGAWERAEPTHSTLALPPWCFYLCLWDRASMCPDCLRTLYEERPGWPWMQSFMSASKYWD